MSFKKGTGYRVFLTLENMNAGICATGTLPTVVTATDSYSSYGVNGVATTTLGVGGLGSVTSTDDTLHEIKNITGLEPGPGQIDAPFEIFGQTRPLDNPIRKDWKLTITRKCETKLFQKLFSSARFGATGSATGAGIFDGLSTYVDQVGYRLYVFDNDAEEPWDLYYHGTIDPTSYKLTLAPNGVTEEQVVFVGGKWLPAIATGSTYLTASESIVES